MRCHASARLARRLGTLNVITTDMGGTSFDVGLILDYEPVVTPMTEVNGYPHPEAGGVGEGNWRWWWWIARVIGGRRPWGPTAPARFLARSAQPRGTEPTVTTPTARLASSTPTIPWVAPSPLDRGAAERAIHDRIAVPLGIEREAASGIKAIADHRMADLLDTLTVGQGHDPRDFVIFAYGGASGRRHCHRFGAELGVQSIIVPATATVHSAFGAVISDLHVSSEISDPMQAFHWTIPTIFDPERINRHFAALESGITAELIASGAKPDSIAIQRFADLRFRMQSKGLAVPVEPGQLTATSITRMMDRFVDQFAELFGEEAVFEGAGAELGRCASRPRARRPPSRCPRDECTQ